MLLRLAYVSWRNVFFFFFFFKKSNVYLWSSFLFKERKKIGTKINIFKRRNCFFCHIIADVANKN